MKGKRVIRIIFVILLSLTTYLMLTPKPPEIDSSFAYLDKLEHIAAFAVLTFLLALSMTGLKTGKIRRLVLCVVLASAYGIIMEYLQILTGRSFELADMAADAVGAVAGGILSFFFFD